MLHLLSDIYQLQKYHPNLKNPTETFYIYYDLKKGEFFQHRQLMVKSKFPRNQLKIAEDVNKQMKDLF